MAQIDGGVTAIADKLMPQQMHPWDWVDGYYFCVPFKQAWPIIGER